jgi:hypothetical protein
VSEQSNKTTSKLPPDQRETELSFADRVIPDHGVKPSCPKQRKKRMGFPILLSGSSIAVRGIKPRRFSRF